MAGDPGAEPVTPVALPLSSPRTAPASRTPPRGSVRGQRTLGGLKRPWTGGGPQVKEAGARGTGSRHLPETGLRAGAGFQNRQQVLGALCREAKWQACAQFTETSAESDSRPRGSGSRWPDVGGRLYFHKQRNRAAHPGTRGWWEDC